MNLPEFTAEFQSLVQSALRDQINVGHIILTLEMAKIELGHMHCMAIQQQQAHAMAKKMASETPKIIHPITDKCQTNRL